MNRYTWIGSDIEFGYMIDYTFCYIPLKHQEIYAWMSEEELNQFFDISIRKKFKNYILLPPKLEDKYQRDFRDLSNRYHYE